jgi:quercetin 2,3-dioxygenase
MGKFAQTRQNDIPNYQEIPSSKIPDGKVSPKVIAGEALNVNAVIKTRTPMMYFHFTLHPKARSSNK